MLASLSKSFSLLASRPAATRDQNEFIQLHFADVPKEYLELTGEVTELELQHESGQYLRIWEPKGCIDMNHAYGISDRIAGAIPIGDTGGGKVIFYMNGKAGFGLYCTGFGDLDADDATFIAPSLSALLQQAVGIDSLL